jgi:hypothetical protein
MVDVTSLIERMVDIEAKLGVRLSALSAFVDDDGDLNVTGEVNFSEPPNEDQSAEVHLLAYDTLGRVIGKECEYVGSEGISLGGGLMPMMRRSATKSLVS